MKTPCFVGAFGHSVFMVLPSSVVHSAYMVLPWSVVRSGAMEPSSHTNCSQILELSYRLATHLPWRFQNHWFTLFIRHYLFAWLLDFRVLSLRLVRFSGLVHSLHL